MSKVWTPYGWMEMGDVPGQTAPDAPYKNSTGAITSLRGGHPIPDAPYKGSTGPITSLRVKDPNGYFDSNTGVFVNRDVRDAQRNKPIAPALGMGGGAPNKSVDPGFVRDALMRNAANQAKMAGAGVRPGAMPPMNAVQAARGQQPTPAPQGMSGSFIPPGAYNPNRPYVGPTPGIA